MENTATYTIMNRFPQERSIVLIEELKRLVPPTKEMWDFLALLIAFRLNG